MLTNINANMFLWIFNYYAVMLFIICCEVWKHFIGKHLFSIEFQNHIKSYTQFLCEWVWRTSTRFSFTHNFLFVSSWALFFFNEFAEFLLFFVLFVYIQHFVSNFIHREPCLRISFCIISRITISDLYCCLVCAKSIHHFHLPDRGVNWSKAGRGRDRTIIQIARYFKDLLIVFHFKVMVFWNTSPHWFNIWKARRKKHAKIHTKTLIENKMRKNRNHINKTNFDWMRSCFVLFSVSFLRFVRFLCWPTHMQHSIWIIYLFHSPSRETPIAGAFYRWWGINHTLFWPQQICKTNHPANIRDLKTYEAGALHTYKTDNNIPATVHIGLLLTASEHTLNMTHKQQWNIHICLRLKYDNTSFHE